MENIENLLHSNITWKDELIRGLKYFGGEAHRKELFIYIKNTTTKPMPREFGQTLQATLEHFSKDSNNFHKNNHRKIDVFYSVNGIGSGVWGLKDYVVDENMDRTQDDISYPEGKEKLRQHIQKERNSKLIRDAKQMFKEKHGKLFCQICGLDFYEVYGDLGKDFIEAHHNKKQISDMHEETTTKIEDLLMLCSNCHSMVHRLKQYNTDITELQKILINRS